MTEESVAHLDEMLGDDRQLGVGDTVEHREHAAGRRVLDRQDKALHIAGSEGSERQREVSESGAIGIRKQFFRCSIAVGKAFALVPDSHGGAPYTLPRRARSGVADSLP
jgi:hypothetical protein